MAATFVIGVLKQDCKTLKKNHLQKIQEMNSVSSTTFSKSVERKAQNFLTETESVKTLAKRFYQKQ